MSFSEYPTNDVQLRAYSLDLAHRLVEAVNTGLGTRAPWFPSKTGVQEIADRYFKYIKRGDIVE
jgi:hypothetical protein